MAWVKMDDKRALNKKLRLAGLAARGLDEAGICWAAHEESDGFLSDDDVEMLAAMHGCKKPAPIIKALVDNDRWTRDEDRLGYWIKNFLEYNPSREDVAATKEWDRRRKALYSDKELIQAVKERDENRCRYCGVLVNWRDRRGAGGGQFDHVTPRGPATIDNIVVACRRCNTAKGGRTPEQARMVLLVPGSMGLDQ